MFYKILDNSPLTDKNVKNNLAFPNKFYSCKDEFDIVIGNFENNTYLIDTIIEVKNLANLILADYKKFIDGVDNLINDKHVLIDKITNIRYEQSDKQEKRKKCFIYKNDVNLMTTNGIILLSSF